MKNDTIQQLNQLNKQFYQTIAASFSSSRQHPWSGWTGASETLAESLNLESLLSLTVLDIGCGNGRFANYLATILPPKIQLNYLGIDQDVHLLDIAAQNVSQLPQHHFSFQLQDIIQTLQTNQPLTNTQPDFVVAFGVFHHIPSFVLRQKLFQEVARLLPPGGIFAVTFWQFERNEALMARQVAADSVGIDPADLEKDDYFLTWERSTPATRYCHLVTLDEQAKLLQNTGLEVIGTYLADGKTGSENRYVLLRKG